MKKVPVQKGPIQVPKSSIAWMSHEERVREGREQADMLKRGQTMEVVTPRVK